MLNPKFVQFLTPDGLTLPGLLFKAKNSKEVAIFLHGNGSNSIFIKPRLKGEVFRPKTEAF